MTTQIKEVAVRIGCAGWAIPKEHSMRFPITGTHLVRYAAEFNAVEINSSFYKSHKPATYAKWSESVPTGFQFAVKVPKEITHVHRLKDTEARLEQFLLEVTPLSEKLGPLLVQLPPSLQFASIIVEKFLMSLRERFDGHVVIEPRHPSWFETEVDTLLARARVARVAADPSVVAVAAKPGGWEGLEYYRLHGSPSVYHSSYSEEYLVALAKRLSAAAARANEVWCIFDNTAAGAAISNAFDLFELISSNGQQELTKDPEARADDAATLS